MFLFSIYCSVLCHCTTVLVFFIGFRVDNSNDNVVLIRQINHFKFMFVAMFYRIWNLRYSKYLRIINYIGL